MLVMVLMDRWDISQWLRERVGVLEGVGMRTREEWKLGILWKVRMEVRTYCLPSCVIYLLTDTSSFIASFSAW